ncbi:polysaccharide deacetylase family protein [Methylocystis parvus]|uniref:Chitooligosaccharide deacetylase n=1 Tax=Methylocystis parvus TaxID=134 RepID=A0A6B8MCA3_9HYPH|nr:polysaccharide deacetylase family protein [Methylocystis parvus]QGM99249.1 polysaccharide deacetylase family protein [Methylocystis parvus]WBK00370.1 polysaccharide deacetylase family protein [Methylocystis parvus OBBP]
MASWRERAIGAGMRLFQASGAHRLAAPFTRGLGAILMFHRVRPNPGEAFAPNAGLEITPDFLDNLLGHLRARGYEILSLDAALGRLRGEESTGRPFVALTFDDGYRDLVEHALPILERRRAPFTAYVTAGFADRAARLWWLEMEQAMRRLSRVEIDVGGRRIMRDCATAAEKSAAFGEIYWAIRDGGEAQLLEVAAALTAQAGVDSQALTAEACLDWGAIAGLARHELATIGAHSLTHPRLAKLDEGAARREMAESRDRIAQETGVTPTHFCYPVGDATSAGAREFRLAATLGFESAVTTRPGMIFPEHRRHLHALPRLSVNGKHQSLAALDVLLSGAPFALMNRGRRVAA